MGRGYNDRMTSSMNPINAIDFLRHIQFPADPIAAHDALYALAADYRPTLNDALIALFPDRTFRPILDDLSDSDFDDLDRILYPND